MPMASGPLLAETTRYPLVASMNLRTDSSCSLSSTQRMIFLGRMVRGFSPCFPFFTKRGQYTAFPLFRERKRIVLPGHITGVQTAAPRAILTLLTAHALRDNVSQQQSRGRPTHVRGQSCSARDAWGTTGDARRIVPSMRVKTTTLGESWKERKAGEEKRENPTETSGNLLARTFVASWNDEYLLKVCASRQEEVSFCYKNSAAADANIADLAVNFGRAQSSFARTADLDALFHRNLLA